jgi:hypothetical protein
MRCNCESAYCDHHGGDLTGEYPTCDPCPNPCDGRTTMLYVGAVCDACAAVARATGAGEYISRSKGER